MDSVSNATVAATIGVDPATIASLRRRLGKPPSPYRGPKRNDLDAKYPGLRARLGQETDAAIAADYGLSRERIRQFRARECRQAFKNELPLDVIAQLGKESDAVIAERFKVPVGIVRRERTARKITAFQISAVYDEMLDQMPDQVGVISDGKLSRKTGIPINYIYTYRHRKGISPAVLSPRCVGFVPHDRNYITNRFYNGATDAEIAAEIGSSVAVVMQIRSSELGLFRRPPNAQVSAERVAEILCRVKNGEPKTSIARNLGMPVRTVYNIVLRQKKR